MTNFNDTLDDEFCPDCESPLHEGDCLYCYQVARLEEDTDD